MANAPRVKTARMTSSQRAKAERELAGWGECAGQEALDIPVQTTRETSKDSPK